MRWATSRRVAATAAVLALALVAGGCEQFQARQIIRNANKEFKAGHYLEAIKLYRESLELDSGNQQIQRSIGLAYMALFRPASTALKDADYAQGAIEAFLNYTNAFPGDEAATQYLAGMYVSTQRTDEAIAFFMEKYLKNPDDAKSVRQMAALYAKKGDFTKTTRWYDQELTMVDDDAKAETLYTIGVLCWDRSYRHAAEITPEERAQVVEQGLSSLLKALEIRPEYFEALTYTNLLYREKAKIVEDPALKEQYTAKANDYLKQAMAIRQKMLAEAGKAPTPTPTPVPAEGAPAAGSSSTAPTGPAAGSPTAGQAPSAAPAEQASGSEPAAGAGPSQSPAGESGGGTGAASQPPPASVSEQPAAGAGK